MNINEDLKLLFIHVPKCAGKSILKAFDLQKCLVLKRSVVEGVLTEHQFKASNKKLSDYIKFGIVRNPWDRLVSLYHFRKRENDLYNLFPDCNVFGGDKTTADGQKLSFKEWIMSPHSKGAEFPQVSRINETTDPAAKMYHPNAFKRKDYLYKMSKQQCNAMYETKAGHLWLTHFLDWIPQIHFLTKASGELIVDKVLRFENINEDIHKFCEEFKLPQIKLPHINKNPRKKKKYVDYYDDELLNYIQDYMQDDIELLGYKFGD